MVVMALLANKCDLLNPMAGSTGLNNPLVQQCTDMPYPDANASKWNATSSHLDLKGDQNQETMRTSSLSEDPFKSFHLNKKYPFYKCKPIREILVVKVSQDDPRQEVFGDFSGVYYTTTRLPHLQLTNTH